MVAVTSSRCLVSTLCCLFYVLLSSVLVPLAASLSFHFNFSYPDSTCTAQDAELACSGDAYLHSTENAIELTKNAMGDLNNNHSVGRLTYTQPMLLWDGATGELASFTTSFTLRIKPARPDSPEPMSADGMAFFLAHHHSSVGVPPPAGSFGRNLGLFNDSTNRHASGDDRVVAVEFDTFRNVEFGEADGNHVGIDVNSIVSVDSVSPNESLKSGETLAAEVAYDNSTETLSVTLWMDGGAPYRVSADVDMRRRLPQMVAVGFSAATGTNVQVHQLLSWSFNSSLVSSREDDETMAPVPFEAITSRRDSKARRITIAVSAAAAVFVIICALIGFVLRRKLRIWRKRSKEASGGRGGELDHEHAGGGEAEFEKCVVPKRYYYSELAAATCNFSEEMKLGRGGFGHVYQGCLNIDGRDRRVAIKKFSESSVQGRKEFEAEVKIISRLRHRNLVQLIGWCDSCEGLLIVYELVSEGSLDRHMYKKPRWLTWPQRYKIIIGLGSALRYLHAEWEQCVVHGDIKPSNIMLDSSLDAKLGDFGLARLVDHGVRPATTKVVLGTAGYIDPELVNTRRPSAVSDVYSFGVVLLELVTGRRPVEEPDDSDELFVLVRWVWRLYRGNAIADAVDERLLLEGDGGVVDDERRRQQMERALVVGLWCAHPDGSERPSIARAMHALQSTADAVKPPVLPPQMYSGDTFHTVTMGGDGYSDLSFGVTSTGSDTSTS